MDPTPGKFHWSPHFRIVVPILTDFTKFKEEPTKSYCICAKINNIMGVRFGLIVADFVNSFLWPWSGVLIKMFVYGFLGFGKHHEPKGEIIKGALSIINMFLFALLSKLTGGAAYNPLTVFASAVTGNFAQFLFTVGARIPVQVLGSITGVRFIIATFPGVGLGPSLNVHIYHGALTEGLLTFAIVILSLALARNIPASFYRKTWISSVCKLSLHILGADLTGGVMNPASVMGWAYARGDHITKEHIFVYWLAPIEATLLAIWTFKLLVRLTKLDKVNAKSKSE